MPHPDPDVLALLALGESAASPEDQRHIAACETCTAEIASLARVAGIGRSTLLIDGLESPPERVWQRIRQEVGLDGPEAAAEADNIDRSAQPQHEPRPDVPAAVRSRRRWTRAAFALAASLAVVGLIAGGWALLRPDPVVQVASATLDAFPAHRGARGTAVVEETPDARTVVVSLDAPAEPGTYREVWLIATDASDLVSLGVLDGSEGEYAVPAGLDLARYALVDVSVEKDDGDTGHSGDSIVRGELTFG